MVAKITAHIQLFNLPVFTKFCKDILVELLEMTLCCFDIEERFPSRSVLIEGRLIHVGIDYSLTLCGFVVKARTTFPVATCTDFEIKGTIHFVLFCAINSLQVVSHISCVEVLRSTLIDLSLAGFGCFFGL